MTNGPGWTGEEINYPKGLCGTERGKISFGMKEENGGSSRLSAIQKIGRAHV